MEYTGIIIFLIYISGVLFNIFTHKYVMPTEEFDSGSTADFLAFLFCWPIIVFQEFIRLLFIVSSWFGWLVWGLILITEKYDQGKQKRKIK